MIQVTYAQSAQELNIICIMSLNYVQSIMQMSAHALDTGMNIHVQGTMCRQMSEIWDVHYRKFGVRIFFNINTFSLQGCMKLIKSDSRHNIRKDQKDLNIENTNMKRIRKNMFHDFLKNITQHVCFQYW